MNRIDRVTAILIHLQSKRVVKAQEIAERFEISLRTVYRDIKTLEEAGIPIVGEAGIGYSIMDGYRLPPVMFTREEATAFLLAEKIVEKYTDPDNSEKYKSALFKIKSVLRADEKEYLEDVDNSVIVRPNYNPPTNNAINHSIQNILKAIREKKVIEISYCKAYSDNSEQRCIEPIGTYLQNNAWYLLAFCRLKNDYRTFRIDRITDFRLCNERFKSQHMSLDEYLSRSSGEESQLHKVVIRVEKEAAKYIIMQKYYYGFISETDKGDEIEMTFLAGCIEGFARWYMTYAQHASIIKPVELKDKVRSLVEQINCRLEESEVVSSK